MAERVGRAQAPQMGSTPTIRTFSHKPMTEAEFLEFCKRYARSHFPKELEFFVHNVKKSIALCKLAPLQRERGRLLTSGRNPDRLAEINQQIDGSPIVGQSRADDRAMRVINDAANEVSKRERSDT